MTLGLPVQQKHDGDVVLASGLVGGVDKSVAGGLKVFFGGDEDADFFVFEQVAESVGTEEEEIVVLEEFFIGLQVEPPRNSDGFCDDVSMGVDAGFLGRDQSGLDLLLNQRMVFGQEEELALAEAIEPAVSDVAIAGTIAIGPDRHQRRTHSGTVLVLFGGLADSEIGDL